MSIQKLLLYAFCIIGVFSCKNYSSSDKVNDLKCLTYKNLSFDTLSTAVKDNFFKHLTSAHVLAEPGYYVWGVSVIKWQGEYHAYYSRWNKKHGHKGWMTNCEIAHAVASKPEGPFEFVNVVLHDRKNSGWDINNAHNPYAIVADGKICLYYISNDIGPLIKDDNVEINYPDSTWFEDNRIQVRNSQCIGVAIADKPAGPFVRSEKPVVKPDNVKFKNIAVNPAVVYRNNSYTMIMKGDDVSKEKWFRIQLVGKASAPDGAFEFSSKPVYDKAQTEDACLWFDEKLNKYYMVCHVMRKRALALFNSENGNDWQLDERDVFMKKEFTLSDGTVWKPERVERPFVLTDEKGQPIMLYVAVADKNVNGNIAIHINLE
ncbi:glycoside hydrolase family protein [Carboxylicivirga marina]|uniref:Glycoside hydrolase family protein n=1 Tax=Carboxylicivirga marina TaxID=2800988 RepID=A0ABS1HN77_9BACT|nr:glycoside hydrolase family protein [Carboxylicivirga marina]MBK3518895.1 glycoside hydrolase family protein [Carboxylicivirga marina]